VQHCAKTGSIAKKQTALSDILIFLDDYKVMLLGIAFDRRRLILQRILLVFGRHANVLRGWNRHGAPPAAVQYYARRAGPKEEP